MKYDYCKMNGYLKEKFYKPVGYPTNFTTKRKVVANCATGTFEYKDLPHITRGKSKNGSPVGGHLITRDQYMQILNMLNKDTSVPQVNMTDYATTLMTNCPSNVWIVDSGMTHHKVASLDVLLSKTELKTGRYQVYLSTGE